MLEIDVEIAREFKQESSESVKFKTSLKLIAEIALAEAARTISAFWKTHSCKLIPNWTRNRMITYTNNFVYVG